MHTRFGQKFARITRIVPVALLLLLAASAGAEITEIRASIEARVLERIEGGSGSTDSSIEEFPVTSPELPIEAFAGLGNFTGELDIEHGGRGIATFADPTLSEVRNPAELGLETDCFSLVSGISYEVASEVVETRDVVLSADDLGVSASGNEKLVVGTAFIEGAIVAWTEDPTRDLEGLLAEIDFRIIQEIGTNGSGDSASPTEETVFETEISLEGLADGEVRLLNSSALFSILGGPELLALAGDENTAALVAALEDVGRVHLAIFPPQSVSYAYFARADEAFKLRAEARSRAVNLPDGTGVAVVFGRPFTSLATAIEPALKEPLGDAVQAAVNRTIQERARTIQAPRAPLCGAMGLEFPLLGTLGMLGLTGAMRRRRRS